MSPTLNPVGACYHRASVPSWRSVRGPSSFLTLVIVATGLACWLLVASPVFAQSSSTPAPSATWPGVLTGARFLVGSEFLNDDARDLRLGVVSGATLDLVDYRVGRLLVAFDFAGVLDDDWNPTHLDYGLEFSPTYRAPFAEVAFVYHHTSRHLHDRVRPEPVFYNLAGFRVSRPWRRARLHGETAGEGLFYFPGWQSGVDYRWEAGGAGRLVYDQSPRWGYFGSGRVRWLGTDPAEYGRDRVTGVRVEAGVRAGYGAGRLEAFVGIDRRIDPAPLAHEAVNLFVLGARLVR